MDRIFESFLRFIPFARVFENTGINDKVSVGLATILTSLLVYLLTNLYKYLVNHYKNSIVAKDLNPYFDYKKVKTAQEYFIQTQFQNESPTREDEPGFMHRFVAKRPLIPFFLKTAFDEKKETDKYYLILADSGMGKTTFMINLYVKNYSFLNFRQRYKMALFPLGDGRILDIIKQIKPEEAKRTILLLDAFDEDKKLIPPDEPDGLSDDDRFRKRLDEIFEVVRDFREVIITSRTQYFPGQETQPYELKIPRFDDAGFHKLAKLYLSPFDSKEIKRYLDKKYGTLNFWNRKKKRQAFRIVNSSPRLMVRPMLLSYIDYLVESNKPFSTTYQLYETLVDKWIEREATKHKQILDREKFKRDLYNYSQLIANALYHKRKESEMLFLSKDSAIEIARNHHIDLKDYEITGQSLLTREASGNWKFAHKSIFEYFIAKKAIHDKAFLCTLNFSEMDMVIQFFLETIFFENFFPLGKMPFTTSNTYQVYKSLVDKWIDRESSKHKQLPDREKFKHELYRYCQVLAKEIYLQRSEPEIVSLSKEATTEVAKKHHLNLKDFDITGQSMLTRNDLGNWEFAHSSIIEFFIVDEAIQDRALLGKINFAEVGMARKFFTEAMLEENFVYVKGGTFSMGSPWSETNRGENEVQHQVTVNDFFICKFTITQAEYEKHIGKNPSHFQGKGKLPVESVSWFDAIHFCNIMNREAGFKNTYDDSGYLLDSFGQKTNDVAQIRGYRLPTEAEWEYACRAGTITPFNTGENLNAQQANFGSKNHGSTKEVGCYPPNNWGLFDMHGNVWEYCLDWYAPYPVGDQINPVGAENGTTRIVRGGSYESYSMYVRSAYRFGYAPEGRSPGVGFRLVLSLF